MALTTLASRDSWSELKEPATVEESSMDEYEIHLVEELRAGRLTRTELLRLASVYGLSISAVGGLLSAAGCGGGEATTGGGEATTATSAASATSTADASTIRRGGVLRVGLPVPGEDVEPIIMKAKGTTVTAELAGEFLCYPDANYELQPKLATHWETGSTPAEWIFTLRTGVQWQDGSPFNADDVVASFDSLTDPDSNSSALSAYSGILSKGNIEKRSDTTVAFHLDRPFVDFPYLVSRFTYNAVILPKDYQLGTFSKGGIGTGPFILEQYVPNQSATFVRNPNYWGKPLPYLDGIEITYFADYPSLSLALQTGNIDLLHDAVYQGSRPLFSNPNVTILRSPQSAYRAVDLRVDMKPFTDKRVRQAIALGLDRPAILQNLLGEYGELGNDHGFAPVYEVSPRPGDLPQRNQDYDLARKLLTDAGYTNGLEATVTTDNATETPAYAVLIKDQLRHIGINVKVQVQDGSLFYGSTGGGEAPWLVLPFVIVTWVPRGVASQTISPAWLCSGVWNSAHWCNEPHDKLMAQLDSELDLQRRREIALEVATIQNEEVPTIVAYWLDGLRATSKRVNDIPAGPTTMLDASRAWLSE
jgi:peptide/nickel transport system substrate-binding protein